MAPARPIDYVTVMAHEEPVGPAILVGDAQVVVVQCGQAELTDLDELRPKDDAVGEAERPASTAVAFSDLTRRRHFDTNWITVV